MNVTLVWFTGRIECKMGVFVSEMWIANEFIDSVI